MERVGLVSRLVMGSVRVVGTRIPPRWKKLLEDRLFYAIFQTTRVTNDAYGWPAPPPGGAPPDVPSP